MFKARIKKNYIKDIAETVKLIVDEAVFSVSESGMKIVAVDPANVALIKVDVSLDAFDAFEATEGKLGVDVVKLVDLIDSANNDDVIELDLDETEHKLRIVMGKLSYKMGLLDPSSLRKEPNIPSLDLPTYVVLKGEEIKRAVKASEKVGDYVTFGVRDDVFFVEAVGDTDKVSLELTKDQVIDLKLGGNVTRSSFSIVYLSSIVKSVAKASDVTIYLGEDMPMILRYKLADGRVVIDYLLAPRVESQ